jgi:uncharacterized protein YjfI (DUF2170 family)
VTKDNSNRRRQQARREKLRAEGLVMREVWIYPAHAPVLQKVEKLLRKPNAHPLIHALKGVSTAMTDGPVTTQTLLPQLQSGQLATSRRYTFSLVEGLEPVIQAVSHDYGDVNVYIAVTGDIAIAQATLFPVARVRDTARLNDRILRTEKLFDLANISIDAHPDGTEFYVIYGALRATSALSDIEFEIDTLARNAVDAAAAYREFVK